MESFILPLKEGQTEKDMSFSKVKDEPFFNPEQVSRLKWIRHAKMLDTMSTDYTGTLSVWDLRNKEYIYVSNKAYKITGYDSHQYMGQNGREFSFSNIHPEYKAGTTKLIEKLYEFRVSTLKKKTSTQQFSASFDYIFKKSDGRYFRNLQLCVEAETHQSGEPLMVINYYFDISHLKKENSQTLLINMPDLLYIYHYDITTQKLIEIKPISKSEITILRLLAAGKQSKQIAEEIHNSSHTVDTHRRNLLSKLNCIDTTALINYAKMTGII